jgi:hypothetical protein
MNEGTDGRTDAFSGRLSQPVAIPVVGISYEHGRSLAHCSTDQFCAPRGQRRDRASDPKRAGRHAVIAMVP